MLVFVQINRVSFTHSTAGLHHTPATPSRTAPQTRVNCRSPGQAARTKARSESITKSQKEIRKKRKEICKPVSLSPE